LDSTKQHFFSFQKLYPKLKAKARMSLLPDLSENKPTSYGLELWFRAFQMTPQVG